MYFKKKLFILVSFLLIFGFSYSQTISGKYYHLGAFVRLQGHPNFSISMSEFDKMMNDTCQYSFSFKSFLKSSSFGQLDYQFVSIRRSDTDTIPYYYDQMPIGYYSPKSDKNPQGFENDDEARNRVHKLTERYIEFLNTNLPDDVKLDGTGDGKIDVLTYIAPTLQYPFSIRSYGGNWAGGIPHNNPRSLKIKGVGIGSFSVNIADSWINPQSNGIFKHEVGHNLRTWDYYDNNNTPSQRFTYRNLVSDPAGAWNMMVGASNTYGAYVIWSRLGYLSNEDVKILNTNGTYRLNSLFSNSKNNVSYKIQSPYSDTEYFILEYRSKHKAFEWWHNSEGLVVTLVNPHVRGNPRGSNNPRAFELFYLRDKENNALFRDISLNQNSSPRLALSDGTPAGFSINKIRIEGNQLVFDLVFDDSRPFIRVVEYPEIVESNTHMFKWQVEVNPKNKRKWKAVSNQKWLNLKSDYNSSQLIISVSSNTSDIQRNAVVELSAPGAITRKAYFVQRGNSTKPVLWMPEIGDDNSFVIAGEENSHNFRIIGDLDGNWWGGNSQITNGRGERQVLHNSVNSVYAYRNTTNEKRDTEIRFRLINGDEKSFKVIQNPATLESPVYNSNLGFLPEANDSKWYFIRTESGRCTNSNFLKAITNSDGLKVSTSFPLYNDSLLWTIEKNKKGDVLLRNKALGYLVYSEVEAQYEFSKIKPIMGFNSKIGVSRDLYYGTRGLIFSLVKDSTQGLYFDLRGELIPNNIKNNSLLFFEPVNSLFLKQFANNMLFSLEGNGSFSMKYEAGVLSNLLNSIEEKHNQKHFDIKASKILLELYKISTSVNKSFEVNQYSQSSWFFIKRYTQATWGIHLEQQSDEYLFFNNRFSDLINKPLDNTDLRFAFQFQKQSEGKYIIYNRAFPNDKLYKNGDKIVLSSNNATVFEVIPIFTFRGLKYTIVDSDTGKYLMFDRRTLKLVLVDRPTLSNLVNGISYLFELSQI